MSTILPSDKKLSFFPKRIVYHNFRSTFTKSQFLKIAVPGSFALNLTTKGLVSQYSFKNKTNNTESLYQ